LLCVGGDDDYVWRVAFAERVNAVKVARNIVGPDVVGPNDVAQF